MGAKAKPSGNAGGKLPVRTPRVKATTSRVGSAAEIPRQLRPRGAAGKQERLLHELQAAHEVITAQNTALTEMARQVEESRDRYFELYDFAPIAYASLDRNGVVIEANLTACRLLGRERSHVVGHPLVAWAVAEDRRACVDHFRRCRVENDAVETELRLTSRTGEVLPVLLSSQTARSDGVVHFRTAIIDLRDRLRVEHERLASQLEVERLKSEEQLAHREKEAKDRWLAVVSHELRTPLTPVLFAISNLTRVTALPGEARRLVDVIRRNSEAELHLIDDLLDMNRISRGKLALNVAHVDLHDLIVSVIESWAPHAQAKGLQIETDLEAADHSIEADAARLRQILLILTTNAVKFTPDGGRIVIGSRNPSTESISIFVTDTGIGFDAGSDERLFEPFEQMGQREAGLSGMGLGLTIARGIVLAHGGRLIAHSPGPGKGATFRVELPLHPKAPLPSEAPSGDR